MTNMHDNPIAQTPPGDPGAQPFPPRRYWLKRIAAGYVLFLAGVVLLSYAAARVAQGRVDRDIRALRAKGQPVLVEDFFPPAIPDQENAAFFLQRAAAPLEKMTDEAVNEFNDLPRTLPLTPAQVALMEKLMAQYGQTLQDIRAARSRKNVNWGIQYKGPIVTTLLPWISPQRSLSMFVSSAAVFSHHQRDDAAAVEYVRDTLMLARAMDHSPFLVSHMVAIGMAAEASATLRRILPGLRIAQEDRPAPPGTKPATRQQVAALVAELLDDQPFREGFVRSMQGERLLQIDITMSIAQGTLRLEKLNNPPTPEHPRSPWARLFDTAVSPLWLNEARALMAWSSQLVEAANETDLPSAMAKTPAQSARSLHHPLLRLVVPALTTMSNRHFTIIYQLRKVGIDLAAMLYELDHGAAPQRLEDLVPGYLPEIPTDPFKGGGAAMPFGPTTPATTKAAGGKAAQ